MGIWDSIKSAAWEANESAHVERLHKDLFPTQQQVQALPDSLKVQALLKFLRLRESVIGQIANWSRDGGLQMAKGFFNEARKLQNFDRCNSLGFALAGLWLESGLRTGQKADEVHATLEKLAQSLIEAESSPSVVHHVPEPLPERKGNPNPNAIDSDMFPDCSRYDFGWSEKHPIPCDYRFGATNYLERMRLEGRPITFSLRRTTSSENFTSCPIEEYLIRPEDYRDQRSWRLFFSPYQNRTSGIAISPFGLA